MRRRILVGSVGLGLLGLPVFAAGADRVSAFIATVAELGCVVDETNEAEVLARLGMSPAEGTEIVGQLMADGRAVAEGDDLRLATGKCS